MFFKWKYREPSFPLPGSSLTPRLPPTSSISPRASSTPQPATRGLPKPLPRRPPPPLQRRDSLRCPCHRRTSGSSLSKLALMVCQPSERGRGHHSCLLAQVGPVSRALEHKRGCVAAVCPLGAGRKLGKEKKPLEATGKTEIYVSPLSSGE